MPSLQIEDMNADAVSAYQHASLVQKKHIKTLLEHLIWQQTEQIEPSTKTAYAFLNHDVWEGDAPADLADNHDHYLYDQP